MITLYQFNSSHFCEKARWALDYKGLPYTRKNLLPGLHVRATRKLAPNSHLPILVDNETIVQDSTSIITYLDERFPERLLTPRDYQAAKEALEWEEYLDEEIGVQIRLWFYYYTLPDRDRALGFLLEGAHWYGRLLYPLIYPKVRSAMTDHMNINAASAKQAQERVLAALERLDSVLKERRFLVADSFTRADLTACALLSPYCASDKSDAQFSAAFPTEVCSLRNQHKNRPFFNWVRDIYQNYR